MSMTAQEIYDYLQTPEDVEKFIHNLKGYGNIRNIRDKKECLADVELLRKQLWDIVESKETNTEGGVVSKKDRYIRYDNWMRLQWVRDNRWDPVDRIEVRRSEEGWDLDAFMRKLQKILIQMKIMSIIYLKGFLCQAI